MNVTRLFRDFGFISFQNNLPLPHFHVTCLIYSFVLWFFPEFCVISGSSFVRLGTSNSSSIKPKCKEVSFIIFHSSMGRWGDHMLMYISLHLCFLVTIPRFHIRPNYFPGLWMVLLNHCLSNDFSDALTSSLLHNWATYSILPRPPLTLTVKQQNAFSVTPRALCIAGFLPVSNRF